MGTWIQLGHGGVAEILAKASYDWVCVDLEHGVIDLETATEIFRVLDTFGCVPAVRVPKNDTLWIRRVLDAGARCIIVPMVNTVEEAKAAVAATKYPPAGVRGFGFCRANEHGVEFESYMNSANEEIAVVMQIEHIDAIENLSGILDVDGVDGVFVGPLDLTGSMGLVGQMDHPEVVQALSRFREVCASEGKSAGMHIVHPNSESIQQSVNEGYTFIALGLDNVFLHF